MSQHITFTAHSRGGGPKFTGRCILRTQNPYCVVMAGFTDQLITSYSLMMLNSAVQAVTVLGDKQKIKLLLIHLEHCGKRNCQTADL